MRKLCEYKKIHYLRTRADFPSADAVLVQELQSQLQEKDAVAAAMTGQLQSLKDKCSQLQASVQTATDSKDSEDAELQKLQTDLETANLRIDTLTEERQSLLTSKESQTEVYSRKEAEAQRLDGEVKELKTKIDRLEAQIQILEVAGQERAEALIDFKSKLSGSFEEVAYLKVLFHCSSVHWTCFELTLQGFES